ncbi:MAG: hypothetical protein M0Q53_04835 [Prolixibacteraceae bacterium]|jgi:hypothetical protein|nr:hypothetical protein [Prolixibacteraceae bacterium]
MKNLFMFVAILLLSVGVVCKSNAQQTAKPVKEKVAETYSRISLTFFMGLAAGVNSAPADAAVNIKFSDKYFNHNLASLVLPLGQDFKMLTFDKKRAYLREMLTKEGVGRKMVAKWFNRQGNGMMNLDYVHQCGLYNASDQDVKMAVAAKRGDAFLKDAGQNLVNKTYVLILVPNDVKSKDDGKIRGWDCQYDFFFYQLIFTPDVVSNFYNVWPYEDDDAAAKQMKVAAFDTLTFKFADAYNKSFQSASVSETLTNNKKPKSLDQLKNDLANRMYEGATFQLDKDLEDFRVKVKVEKLHPTRAKIGKKEALKCDQQFFVYQYKFDESKGTVSPVRQAVVRSTSKIANNKMVATGASPMSSFYQTYGGTIQEGMILQQKLDFGLSLAAGFESGGIGGLSGSLMLRTGQFTNVTGLYLMIDGGYDSGKKSTSSTFTESKYNFLRYSIGLGKGLRLARIVELTPYIQYGIEQTKDKTYKDISTNIIKAGGVLGINLTHNIYLVGSANYYMPFGDISVKNQSDAKSTLSGKTWDTDFNGRSGLSIMGGLRIEF